MAAERRKLLTLTPGTSTGYCVARNTPARARSSTLMASTSSPSSVMLPPVTVSLPFKLLLFVMVDGWGLVIRSLVASYTG